MPIKENLHNQLCDALIERSVSMEENPKSSSLRSGYLKQSVIQDQLHRLEGAIEEAQEIIDYETAHNPEILYALDIVEDFIRSKKRVCYGGTAINAILPTSLQFYDSEKDLPDYDFFTPDPENDIKQLVKRLQDAGFQEINQRFGVHEGTFKILVNFIPIADCTHLHKDLYRILAKRAIRKDGLYYCDPDFLKMMMYLELSRPRGEVERWSKVYERLLLLNHSFPMKPKCKELPRAPDIDMEVRETLLDFLLEKNRIFLGAEIAALYSFSLKAKRFQPPGIQWFLRNGGAVVFLTPAILQDSLEIRNRLGKENSTVEVVKGLQEMIPDRVIIRSGRRVVAVLIEETACHSFNTITIHGGKKLLIGTPDTLITVYLMLHIFTKDEMRLGYSIQCLCQQLIDLSRELRKRKTSFFPGFSVSCTGYQKGFSTLLRERAGRIMRGRKKQHKTRSSKKRGGAFSETRRLLYRSGD